MICVFPEGAGDPVYRVMWMTSSEPDALMKPSLGNRQNTNKISLFG